MRLFVFVRKLKETGPEGGAVSWQRVTLILELLQHKKKLKRAQMLVPALFSLLARYGLGPMDGVLERVVPSDLLFVCLCRQESGAESGRPRQRGVHQTAAAQLPAQHLPQAVS